MPLVALIGLNVRVTKEKINGRNSKGDSIHTGKRVYHHPLVTCILSNVRRITSFVPEAHAHGKVARLVDGGRNTCTEQSNSAFTAISTAPAENSTSRGTRLNQSSTM